MNDKLLTQIDDLLAGQKRYKLLDCSQTNILKLKGAKLQVLLAHILSGNDDEEAWLSLDTLELLTGLSRPAVSKARQYLTKEGWLPDTGGTAADKYQNPTRRAHLCKILSVGDPIKGNKGVNEVGKESLPPPPNPTSKESLPNVSVSGFGCFSRDSTSSVSGCISDCSSFPTTVDTSLRDPERRKTERTTKNKNNDKTKSKSPAAWCRGY
jgi:hypothetical protein